MIATLLMRLAGPMQSWGVSSRFSERDSLLEPSKSGVVGILAAALGRDRSDTVDDLRTLRMGVRVDKEGHLAYDFHTAGAGPGQRGIIRAQGSGFSTSISRRFHLQDAIFLVGLEGDDAGFLHSLDAALRMPVHPLGLGRRSLVPSVPIAMEPRDAYPNGVRGGLDLKSALEHEPWPVADLPTWLQDREQRRESLRLVLEDPVGPIVRPDQPVGAAFATRVFGPRQVSIAYMRRPQPQHHATDSEVTNDVS